MMHALLSALTLTSLVTGAASLVDALVRAAVQGGLFIALLWLLARAAPRMPAGLRAGLWWLACLKLLVTLTWIEPVALPLVPERLWPASVLGGAADAGQSGMTRTGLTGAQEQTGTSAAGTAGRTRGTASPTEADHLTPAPTPSRASSVARLWLAVAVTLDGLTSAVKLSVWPAAVALLWAAGVAWRLARLTRDYQRLRGIVARATPAPATVMATFERLRADLALAPRRSPSLQISDEVRAPQVFGARRPVILLPAGAVKRLSAIDLSMTLCHELTHVKRGDLWLGWIPALAHELFFFHPLAALAAREYGIAREAACDAAVIRHFDAEPHAYGRLLIALGVAPAVPLGRAPLAATCSSSSVSHLKRRLHMLQHLPLRHGQSLVRWAPLALVIAGLVPVQLVAQRSAAVGGVEGGVPGGVAGGVHSGVGAGVSSGIAAGEASGVTGGVTGGVTSGVAGGVGAGVASGAGSGVGSGLGSGVGSGAGSGSAAGVGAGDEIEGRLILRGDAEDSDQAWVYVRGERRVSMSGRSEDVKRARSYQRTPTEPLLWFRHDGSEYIVRDAALLAQIDEAFKPMEELGNKQGALGDQQGALGDRQGALGNEQGKLGDQQGALGNEQGKLAIRRTRAVGKQMQAEADAADKPSPTTAQLKQDAEKELAEIERLEDELRRKQEALGEEQSKLGEKQSALGREQSELGEQQSALGLLQAEASRKAERVLRELTEKSIATGLAEKVR